MKLTVTARELFDYGLWMRACKVTGLNEWAVNEGLMQMENTVEIEDAGLMREILEARERARRFKSEALDSNAVGG